MASEQALIGVAYALFFPSFSSYRYIGILDPAASDFLTWKSRLWVLGGNAALPIFDAGRNQANLNLAYAKFYETVFDYQQQVLVAFKEVEDALVNLEWQDKEFNSYRGTHWKQRKTRICAPEKVQCWLCKQSRPDQQRAQELQARLNVVNALGSRYQSTVLLIKALGGAWNDLPEALTEEPGCP